MKKPHEQGWKVEAPGVIRINDATTLTVHIAPWRLPRVSGSDEWKMAAKVSEEVTAFALAAPDMARVALALKTRGESAVSALPGNRTVDDFAGMDTTISVPASVLRDALAALRKAGIL